MLKKIFICLVAANALLVLFVVMNQERTSNEEVSNYFEPQGKKIEVVTSAPVFPQKLPKEMCGELGPLVSLEQANQISKRLVARNIANNVYEKEVVVSTDYWVIIPPRASEKQAFRLLKQLQLANIDSYIVTQGDYANAISLGLFTVKASAYRIREKMVSAGFDAIVQEIERSQKRYLIEFAGDAGFVRSIFSDSDLNIFDKACKSH
jgi:cell division protein FtsN